MLRRFKPFLLCLVLIAPQPAGGQTRVSMRRVHFTTHEGSWLAFDLSRDGRRIVFDLLGQLWELPIEGGAARPITDVVRDSAEFIDPSFAPNGGTLLAHGEFRGQRGVFSIDRGGASIRLIAADTLDWIGPTQSPAWDGDQSHILRAKRDPPVSGGETQETAVMARDVLTGEEHRIDVSGVDGAERHGLALSADHNEIFFNTVDRTYGPFPPAGRIWRVPIAGGRARPVTPIGVLARAAAPSPDGRRVAYFVIDSSGAQVWLQDLGDSVGVRLTSDRDVTPTRIRWLPGGDTIVYAANGRLWRLDVRTRARREIPFSATVDFERKVASLPPIRFASPGDRVVAHGSRGFAMAPDGRSFAVIMLDGLWIVSTNAATPAPHKLASLPPTATAPAWSPDGRQIVWTAGKYGTENLFVTDTLTRRTRRVTRLAGLMIAPVWSPDGRLIVFTQITRDSSLRVDFRLRALRTSDSIVTSPANTIDLGPIAPGPGFRPAWSPASNAVLVLGPPAYPSERRASLRFPDGSPLRPVRGLPYDVSFVQWLPGDTLVFLAASRLWRAPFNSATAEAGKATPISEDAAAYLSSSPHGDLLYISDDGFRIRSGSKSPRHIGWPITYEVPTPPPLVIRNVRIVDGTGSSATAGRDVLVERGRVKRIAPAGTIEIPAGTQVVDGGGRIAIPGLIDMHSHHGTPADLRGLLYFGVTTIRSIGGWQRGVAHRDAVASGEWPGPRVAFNAITFDTDVPYNSEGGIGLLPEADPQHLARGIGLLTGFAGDFVKIHSNEGFATQMRIVAASHAVGRRVTGHCAYPLALVAAGIDSKEHLGWQCTVHDASAWHDDLIQLHAQAQIPVTPTLALFAGLQRLHGTRTPVPAELRAMFENEIPQLVASVGFEPWSAAHLINTAHAFDAAGALHRAGVVIGAGTDFELPDGVHYELEALTQASFSPLDAIAAATSQASRIMGASADVGRIASGLLADIVILDADPTDNIRNTRQIWRVIQGGRVVDRQQLYAPGWDTVYLPK
jgi:Tol biopolymer transport system component